VERPKAVTTTTAGGKEATMAKSPDSTYKRQRTLSEGNVISPSRLRTLSGSQQQASYQFDSSNDVLDTYTRRRTVASKLSSLADTANNVAETANNLADTDAVTSTVATLPIARKSKPT